MCDAPMRRMGLPATIGATAAVLSARRDTMDQIKSATRVLRIFEYFEQRRREASVMDIARALAIPQSSTSMLLKNLSEMGYLQHDVARRAFMPSPKFAQLGAWIAPVLEPAPALTRAMEAIGAATGGTVMLGTAAGDNVRYVHVVPATTALRLHLRIGTLRPLAVSGMGRLLMAQMPLDQVREIVRRYNASLQGDDFQLAPAAVSRDLAVIRKQGYSKSLARITPGAGVVSVLLPGDAEQAPMALGIGAPVQAVQENFGRWVALMQRVTARHLRA